VSKRIIIIGAGIAGLSAGCYAIMNGFDVQIYEMNKIPGGLCTAWQRKGYTFDVCVHWLVGSSPSNSMHRIWRELGLIEGRHFINYEYFARVVDEQGNELVVSTDPDRLEDSMLKMLPELRLFYRYGVSVPEFAKRFRNPILRELFTSALEWHDMSLVFIMMTLGWMHNGAAGYPIGGSIPLAKSIEDRFLKLGGRISYRSKVSKILVENDKASGVGLADGTEAHADIVLSAADGHSTIFDLLEGKYADNKIRGYYKELPIFPPLVFVALGVNANLADEPTTLSFPLKKPITVGGIEHRRIRVRNHSFDPTLAPPGRTVLTTMITTDYDYWARLGEDTERYKVEKKRVQEAVIGAICERYPEIESKIEVVDVATPLTFVRYTGNWRGSYEGWQFTKKTMAANMKPTLPGLSNFYMAGQWIAPGGGLPGAAGSARKTIEALCKKEGVQFKTSIP
jgi:phytoene dehydrogenase-like protein